MEQKHNIYWPRDPLPRGRPLVATTVWEIDTPDLNDIEMMSGHYTDV